MAYIYKKPFTMKTTYLLVVLFFLVLTSCDWFDSANKADDSGTIGGSSSISVNTVGNTFLNSVQINGISFAANSSITVTKVENGVATIGVKSKLPANNALVNLIAAKYKDASGNLDCTGKVKMTDEGILDYTNKDEAPFVLVKYDAKVGDKYVLEKSDGSKITREVVRKSTADDYYWGGMMIKTIDVEQDSRIPGIKKIVYFTNHKFGLVGVRLYMEDGTTSQLYLSSTK